MRARDARGVRSKRPRVAVQSVVTREGDFYCHSRSLQKSESKFKINSTGHVKETLTIEFLFLSFLCVGEWPAFLIKTGFEKAASFTAA